MNLLQELEIGDKSLVTMLGGGGKTTGIFLLADLLKKSLITTSTKMFKPPLKGSIVPVLWPSLYLENEKIPLIYSKRVGDKLIGLSLQQIEEIKLKTTYHHILCEGDGARMKPLKVWKEGEPLIPPSTTHTIINIGGIVLGNEWGPKWVHRWELLPLQGKTIDFDILLKMVEQKVFNLKIPSSSKLFLVFNQWDMVDNEQVKNKGELFAYKIKVLLPELHKILFVSYEKNKIYMSL